MTTNFTQNTIALIYDFDGTLSPQPMQEYTVFPEIGISAEKFWAETKQEALDTSADGMLTYMRLLIEKMELKKKHLDRPKLKKLAKSIKYFPGVEGWFDRVNSYVKNQSNNQVQVKHYIISAGLKEILQGVSIGKHFQRMYASEYFFDHHGVAKFPTIVINDISKTQYLFRINKGVEDVNHSINAHMPESERPIPFQNMIYIGDGSTDVPSMAVNKKNGGFSVAVHKADDAHSIETCKGLMKDGRIDFYALADYRASQILEKRICLALDVIIAKIQFEKEIFSFIQTTKI